jgi:hypothetical protein
MATNGDSAVTFSFQSLVGGNMAVLKASWLGDSGDGSVPAATTNASVTALMQGWTVGMIETIPDATVPPTNLYDITITDMYSLDIVGGVLANRSSTVAQRVIPLLNGVVYGAAPIYGALTINITGNTDVAAVGTILLFLYR